METKRIAAKNAEHAYLLQKGRQFTLRSAVFNIEDIARVGRCSRGETIAGKICSCEISNWFASYSENRR
jgi:hypothetical protein